MPNETTNEHLVPTVPGHRASEEPTGSTLFVAATDDPAKQHAIDRSIAAHHALDTMPGMRFATDEVIVIVLHPGFELLDLVGPFHFLAGTGATVHLATTGPDLQAVRSGSGAALVPTVMLEHAPDAPTVLLVPGGDTGILLRDVRAMAALQRLAEGARFVTSVCSGSIALAAAGLEELRAPRAERSTNIV